MNYLAHSYLSPSNPLVRLGNIACDMIRPDDSSSLPADVLLGMALHHSIDRYTDSHLGFCSVRNLLNRNNLPYAGVFCDIIFDHCLARDWHVYSDLSLMEHSELVYGILRRSIRDGSIPGDFRHLADSLIRNRWFESYAKLEGLEMALTRLNHRSSMDIPVLSVMNLVVIESDQIEGAFASLMRDLILHFPPG